ncbi:MAG: hypothetical protein NVS2B3_09200 [Vulcanimicrobiaceae bacterium]
MIVPLALALLAPTAIRADERFTLDIASRTIVRETFAASVEVGVDRPIVLHVGVALRADDMHVDLRGITGDVRFRADLSPITSVIDRHTSHNP